jgi:gamma-butyrobetaine dioxygenase
MQVSDEVILVDGARFHLVWLRDNCLCPACQDAGTAQKLFDITATELAPRLRRSELGADALRLVWDEDPPHESRYPRTWLRRHAYDPPRPVPIAAIRLWERSGPDLPPPRRASDPAWRDDLLQFGFALLTGLDADGFAELLRAAGPVTPTEFGPIAPLQARPDANDLGETGTMLDPHTDYTVYMQFPPVIGFLHCLRNESDGGASTLVDGFAAAEHLRRHDPAAFERLVRTPLPFHQLYPRWGFHHLRLRPMIELDDAGAVRGVHVGHPHTRNWSLPFADMLPTYVAYASFIRLLNDPGRQFRHRLAPGECLAYQNERVLHGRTGFSPATGDRHLQIAYVNWSYLTARRRFDSGAYRELALESPAAAMRASAS